MQLTTLLISFFLAATALTSPLLAKRDLYNIDGEPIPDFQMEIDKRGHIVPPADWPYYDSLDMQCQGHKNYVPRINVGKWKKECVSKIYQWKVDHNIFESREVAAEAKANEARRRQINEQKHQNRLRDCRMTPKTARCRMLLLEDAKRQEVEEQGGDGEKKAIA